MAVTQTASLYLGREDMPTCWQGFDVLQKLEMLQWPALLVDMCIGGIRAGSNFQVQRLQHASRASGNSTWMYLPA